MKLFEKLLYRLVPKDAKVLLAYAKMADVRPSHVALPPLLGLLQALLEAASFSLLIPLSQGVARNSLAFLWDTPVLRNVKPYVPATFFSSPSFEGWMTIGVVAVVFFLRLLVLGVDYVVSLYTHSRNHRYQANIRRETFRHMLTFGRQYFSQRAVGQTHTMLEWSAALVNILGAVDDFLNHSLRLIAKVSVMIAISLPLTISMGCAFPLVQLVTSRLTVTVRRIAEQVAHATMRVQREVFDILSTIPLVKAYSREEETSARYGATLEITRDAGVRQERIRLLNYPSQEGVVLMTMLLTMASTVLWQGDFRPGDLARFCAFLLVAQQTMPNFMGLHRLRLVYLETSPLLDQLRGLVEEHDAHKVPEGDVKFEGLRKGIAVKNLSFSYNPDRQILNHVNAFFPAGKMTAVVGGSGVGKTTLVDLVARFYDCPAESIFFDEHDVRTLTLRSLHGRMAIASQEVWLLNRSLRENLIFGLDDEPSDTRLVDVLEAMQLRPLLERLPEGLSTEVGDRGVKLSGGERQRLALARSLLRDPEILILDEATSALDSLTEQRVQKIIAELTRGRTVIAIAHRLSTIRHADQILVVADGKVSEHGTWDQLVAQKGEFYHLWNAQMHASHHDAANTKASA